MDGIDCPRPQAGLRQCVKITWSLNTPSELEQRGRACLDAPKGLLFESSTAAIGFPNGKRSGLAWLGDFLCLSSIVLLVLLTEPLVRAPP